MPKRILIAGGGYIAVPGECRFSVIGKLRPGETLEAAVAGFEAAVQAAERERLRLRKPKAAKTAGPE